MAWHRTPQVFLDKQEALRLGMASHPSVAHSPLNHCQLCVPHTSRRGLWAASGAGPMHQQPQAPPSTPCMKTELLLPQMPLL